MAAGSRIDELADAVSRAAAGLLSCVLHGDASRRITGVAPLQAATGEQLSFLANPRYRGAVPASRAGAIVLGAADRRALFPAERRRPDADRVRQPLRLVCPGSATAGARRAAGSGRGGRRPRGRRRLDEVIDYALDHQADVAVFAGDAFKNRKPDPTQQREFAQRIKRLADAMPTLLLVGNHDMPGMAVRASAVDIFQALAVPGVIVGHKAGSEVVETGRGPVFLAWMPYPMRNRLLVRDEHQGKTIDELELALRQTVSEILAELAEETAQHAMPRVLAGHFSGAEAKLGSGRTVMLGRDVAVMTSVLADPAWEYVALGHIHRVTIPNPAAPSG